MKNIKTILGVLFFLLFHGQQSNAQTKTLLYVEYFDTTPVVNVLGGVALNTLGSIGTNKWVINNEYNGNGKFPNTPTQTITQGNIGTIGTPDGKYMHIYSTVDTPPANTNFNPGKASDSWVEIDAGCTLGYSSVILAFFWVSGGSDDAYGEIFYSADNSPIWNLCTSTDGIIQYNYNHTWQYTVIKNPDFIKHFNLRFAFHWQNAAASSNDSIGFALDDIFVVGTSDDPNDPQPPVVLTAVNITPDPVCQEDTRGIQFTFSSSDSLCAGGTYQIEISDSFGNFNSPYAMFPNLTTFTPLTPGVPWSLPLINPNTGKPYFYFPTTLPPATCYKWRIRLTTPPYSSWAASSCFTIDNSCPESITTLQPAVTLENFVCECSVIDVPFYSYGAYNAFDTLNEYLAELSDSSGSFANPDTIAGPSASIVTYDPALGDNPSPPCGNGMVSGRIPTDIPEGCNYFIRVVSTNPNVQGTSWGPFCIKKCDIRTNNCNDVSVCISNLYGDTVDIPIDIHQFTTTTTYGANNRFEVQILDPKQPNPMDCINPTLDTLFQDTFAILGTLFKNNSGTLSLKIPPIPVWTGCGFKLQMYYIRVIATNSSDPADVQSTIVRLMVNGVTGIKLPFDGPDPDPVCARTDNINLSFTAPPALKTSLYEWRFFKIDTVWKDSSYHTIVDTIVTKNYTNPYCAGINFTKPDTIWKDTVRALFIQTDTVWKDSLSYHTIIDTVFEYRYRYSCDTSILDYVMTDTIWVDSVHTPVIDSFIYHTVPDNILYSNHRRSGLLPFGIASNVSFNMDGFLDGNWGVTLQESADDQYMCAGPVSDTVPFTIGAAPFLQITGPPSICLGETVTYTSPYQSNTYYEWQFDTAIMQKVTISNNEITIVAKNYGSTTVKVWGLKVCGDAEASMIITVLPATQAVAHSDTTICKGDTANLYAENINPTTGNSGFNSFIWFTTTDTVGRDSSIFVAPDTTTVYTTRVDFFGCNADACVTVTVQPVGEVFDKKHEICLGDSVQLNAGKGTDIKWTPSTYLDNAFIINPFSKPDTTIKYTVYASYNNGCKNDTGKIEVKVKPVSFCQAGSDVLIIRGQSATINGCAGDSFVWYPGTGLNDSTLMNPIASPDSTTIYTIRNILKNGCESTDEVTVTVVDGPKIIIPNAFSPNGDGENDVFFPIGVAMENKLLEFKIYNRWGEIVFETTDIHQGWDGTYKGTQQEIGTYVYYIKAQTLLKEPVTLQGSVTLIR